MNIHDVIYITLLLIFLSTIIGLNIIAIIDKRLSNIKLNIPECNCNEKFTNYIKPSDDIPIVVSNDKQNTITVDNKPSTDNQPTKPYNKSNYQQLLLTPTAEDYYRFEYNFPFSPIASNNNCYLPANDVFYKDIGNSEHKIIPNFKPQQIYSYEYLQDRHQI